MNETHFGLEQGFVSEDVQERAAMVAEVHEARFVCYIDEVMANQPPRYWFSCRTRDELFVIPTVLSALRARNLWPLPFSSSS